MLISKFDCKCRKWGIVQISVVSPNTRTENSEPIVAEEVTPLAEEVLDLTINSSGSASGNSNASNNTAGPNTGATPNRKKRKSINKNKRP